MGGGGKACCGGGRQEGILTASRRAVHSYGFYDNPESLRHILPLFNPEFLLIF